MMRDGGGVECTGGLWGVAGRGSESNVGGKGVEVEGEGGGMEGGL